VPGAPRRVVSTTHAREIHPAVYAIPFDTVWESVTAALRSEGARLERADDTAGLVHAHGEGGFPSQRWTVEARVGLDSDAQTRVELTVTLLEGLDLGRTARRARRIMARIDQGAGADVGSRLVLRDSATAGLLAALLVGGCGGDTPPLSESDSEPTSPAAPASANPLRTYERAIAFRAADGDSSLAVVWLFEHADIGSGVTRDVRGLLLRGGVWDGFFSAFVTDPPSESPWRLLPTGPLKLVVGTGDRVDRLVYEQEDRLLELELRGSGASWTGRRGGSFSVEDAAVVLGDRAVPGVAVDLSRAWVPDEAPTGDWALLTSGDSIAVVLQAPMRSRDENAWQGWILRGGEESLLPELTVTWTETRAFDEARRDVPIAWSLTGDDGELTGSFELRTADLRAVDAEGPLLPVRGVIDVTGVVRIGEDERRVEGLVYHAQGDPSQRGSSEGGEG